MAADLFRAVAALGIPSDWLKKGTESRGMPITAYRQLAMALMCRLTKLSLNTIARLFDVNDHSTVIHARGAMAPILDATGLTEADSVPIWVEACLPLLFVHVAEHRAKNRTYGVAMNGAKRQVQRGRIDDHVPAGTMNKGKSARLGR